MVYLNVFLALYLLEKLVDWQLARLKRPMDKVSLSVQLQLPLPPEAAVSSVATLLCDRHGFRLLHASPVEQRLIRGNPDNRTTSTTEWRQNVAFVDLTCRCRGQQAIVIVVLRPPEHCVMTDGLLQGPFGEIMDIAESMHGCPKTVNQLRMRLDGRHIDWEIARQRLEQQGILTVPSRD